MKVLELVVDGLFDELVDTELLELVVNGGEGKQSCVVVVTV